MSGIELLVGAAGVEATATAAAVAPTAGLFGAGGAVTAAQTLTTLGALGGAVGAASALASGQQQGAVAEYNAKVAAAEADATKQATIDAEEEHRRKASALLSQQRATYAAAGVDLEGSPLDVMSQTAAMAERDAIRIRNSGTVQELQARSQSAVDNLSARSARTSSYWKAGSSLLTGVSSLSRIYGST